MIILPRSALNARKRERTLRPARPPRSARKEYSDVLEEQVRLLKAQTANLSELFKSGASRAEVASTLASLSAQAQARFDALAPNVAASFVGKVDKANKQANEAAIARALSVDFATIVDGTDVGAFLDAALVENVNLIKSIPAEHFGKVARAVMDNYRGVPLPGDVSLTTRLQQLGGVTQRRARFIARDQTAKVTGDLNQARQEDNGIDEYRWRNSQDRRVVGNPGGLYPKGNRAHGNHWDREGETFKWSAPPPDGHPGHAPGCRCGAEPVLNLDKIKAQYV